MRSVGMSTPFTAIRRFFHLLVITLLCTTITQAIAEVAVPPLTAHITDLTGILTQTETMQLEQQLTQFESRDRKSVV